ncbi:cubilin-like [Portunus trituberculatus]|nr:cubilin-like [Portunus trituberculatus]XP_045117386.1 cubilin-like [Portunus trituberculatus]
MTPESSRQRLQQLNTLLASLQQTTSQTQLSLQDVTQQMLPTLQQTVAGLSVEVNSLPELRNRLQALEIRINGTTTSTGTVNITSGNYLATLTTLQREVFQIKSQLMVDECASGPCRNGGICIDGYLKFTCLCPKGWQGGDCNLDSDECVQYAGTDLGCQNGATCINFPGSFRCLCPPGKFGVLCDQQSSSCTQSSGSGLCGSHGNCVSSSGQHGYTCICDEGWKSQNQGNGPTCVDVDECASQMPHCSSSPAVQCINYPGGFTCGPCPQGFSGNGFVCNDIDECQINNGGCSPFSQCYNTYGGRRCGPCATGYTGDGTTCTPSLSPCQTAQCHPLATCYENAQISPSYYQCVCPQGYQGSGMGPYGCTLTQGTGHGTPTNWCSSQPCLNGGTCSQNAYSYTCVCLPGYTGQNCQLVIDMCANNPCLNGGTCTQGFNSFTCSCPSSHTGDRCQTENQQCGGTLSGNGGVVSFPGVSNVMYNHNLSCAWIIAVPRGQVINITFSYFHLEGSYCHFDWLQIHDGPSSGSHLIGRYCGTSLPGSNGTIITTHNSVYLWFRSDHSMAGYGFNFTWNVTSPVCGGDLHGNEYGSFKSPGYPGHYPVDRDCYWTITVSPGKRIKFHFPTLQLEHHPNCSFDFLEIRDGLTENGHSLGKYCSSVTPEPLTTSGSEAFVHFHSDLSLSDTGFLISYSAEPGIPGCGGLLTSDQGEFSAPTISDSYEHNLHCEWVIRVPPEETVQLNFTEFHLEHHHACRWDYVEIRDGGSADSPLVRRACGTNLPSPVMSTGRQLYILFHSDFSVSRPGFRAVYQVACGGEYTGDTGLIRSPYNPQPYPGNRECIYLISQPVGKAIVLNFTFFDIEGSFWGHCSFDYIELRDGRRPTSPSLGRYCGPETHRPNPIVSTHNYMWIKFRTDGSVHDRGFVANYTTIDTTCGGVLTGITGVITSPNSPETYPTNTDCRWVLDLPPNYVIQITWQSFSLEHHTDCQYDYIEIFDNSSIAGQSQRMGSRLCGSTLPPIMTSSDNLVTIHFHSDSSVNHDGFSAVYHGLDATRACGGHYHTEMGIITSPNYPQNYPDSRICEWTITAVRGHQIHLNFLHMEVEPSTHCDFDAVEIRNGRYATSPLLAKVCGLNTTVPDIYSHSHQLYIKFTADYSVTYRGFKLQWDSTTLGCGGLLTGVTGGIISPGYPQPYSHLSDCYWTIRVSQGSFIQLHFTDMDLEPSNDCTYDFVEVRDGSTQHAPLIGKYCSQEQGIIAINSTTNTLWIRFRADTYINGRGFKATYVTECNRKLSGPRGVITTPNFPDPYPHNRNCTWIIEAPKGNSINASFSDFVLEDSMNEETGECYYDFVEVREAQGLYGTRNQLGHYCRRLPPPVFTSARHNILEINFVSDMSVAMNGFRLEWIVNGCGGELTKPSETFTSPGYPNAYPRDTVCEWHIQTDPGTRIRITINEIDIESATDCIYDALHVYGGRDKNSVPLVSLCHHQTHPIIVTSQGNHAFVSFESDQNVRGKGFNISYTTLHDGCGGLFTAPEGSIHSPHYPNNYNNESDCTWTIKTDPMHVVLLNFTDFNVQSSSAECEGGFVQVYDGEDVDASLLLQHCGSSLPQPRLLQSTGSSLTVRLKADGQAPSKGFTASYKRGCGASIAVAANGNGEIKSPNFPNYYTSGLNCSWHLNAPEGSRMHLHIVHLDMHHGHLSNENCTYDYLVVLDGAFLDSPERSRFCGSYSPRPLVSIANHLTIHVVSDPGVYVSFRAVYSTLTSTCGGDLTSVSGELASPLYPEPYPVNLDCVWTIIAGPGNQLQLNFIEFDVEESSGCNQDYIEVHEMNPEGPLLLHNCSSSTGSTLPPSITVHDTLWIRFHSDGVSAGGHGFLASYNILFGSQIYGNEGEVVSPMYPQRYMGSQDVSWTITVPWGKYVSLTFLDLDVEGDPADDICYASLVIYNGGSARYSPVLGTYCGHQTPTEPIVSRWRRVLVHLNAHHLHTGSKFRFQYQAIDTRGELGVTQTASDSNCTYVVTLNSSSTYIRHPGFPSRPANGLNCEWLVQAQHHERIYIALFYDLEESSSCQFDFIIVYDGLNGEANWNETARLCRRDQMPFRFTSSGRLLRFRFITDSSVQSTRFTAVLKTVCGGNLHQPEGYITSPGYPENYSRRQDCVWVIKVGIGRTIKLEFTDFKIANSTPTCADDYLVIQNGESTSSPFLAGGKFCGSVIPAPMESTSNALRIRFVSDNVDSDKGFKLSYHELTDACGGSHQLTSDFTSVTITSPNYPNSPHPHTECSWVTYAPPEKSLSLHFEGSFEIPSYLGNCDQAFVEVRDGGTLLSPLLGRFCGTTLPETQHTTGDVIFVRYFNNLTQHHVGFKAKASTDICGGTYNVEESRIFTSPGYPMPYAASLNCTWKIVAPLGHYLTVSFLQVEISSPDNNCTSINGLLKIRDINSTGDLLSSVCGSPGEVASVRTSSNRAYVTFTSESNDGKKGFRIMFNSSHEVCGGLVSGAEGEIRSPGYPHGYAAQRLCEWLITAPPGKRIKLEFLDFDIQSQYFCRDYMEIWNGGRGSGANIGFICNRLRFQTYNSSTNIMSVIFRTRGHSNGRGFRLRWTSEDPQECGGELDIAGGTLFGPERNNFTYNTHYCIWTLNNPNPINSSFVISFTQLENFNGCHSYILIEGENSEGQQVVVKKVCNTDTLLSVVVPYHSLRITFVKVRYFTRFLNWTLDYSISPCGGVLRGPQNVITSPNFPSNYPNNAHCGWLFHYEEGEQIDFQFTTFNLENAVHHDYVRVFNGPRLTSPLLGRYTGNENPGNVGRSMTNNMFVEFNTDDSTTRQGFRAVAVRHTRGCGGKFHGLRGNFSSNGFPEDYEANTECEWEIDTPAGYHAVISFTTQFDVETSSNCQNDYVQVYHAEQSEPHTPITWISDRKLCGKQLPQPIISSGSRVKLLFHTNGDVQGSGFQASWQMLCGNNYTQQSGYMVSPGHPNNYPAFADCDYRIVANRESFVNIQFLSFNVENARNCRYDHLTVIEEHSGQSWGPYCGGDLPHNFTTRGSTLLRFHSDFVVERSGFVAKFEVKECGGNLTAPGELSLPTQSRYLNHMMCVWDVTAPEGKVPYIKFQQLVLETHRRCRYDSISVYEGHSSAQDNLVARFCGNHTLDLPVVTTHGNKARVVFSSDHIITMDGFRASLEFTYACGENVNISAEGASHTIRSFSLSNSVNYEPLLHCVWLVEGLEDQVVTLNFTRLQLEPPNANDSLPCPYDRVEIYDGPSSKSDLISAHCNSSTVPFSVSSSTNLMYIRFISDSSQEFPGFTATLTNTPHPCGDSSLHATNESQVLQSPGYPNQYPLSIRCRWIISASEADDDIHLEINEMNLEISQLCSKDQLYISEYVPQQSQSQVIHSGSISRYSTFLPGGRRVYFFYGYRLRHGYCGNTIPHHLTSSTNAVELRFISDASVVSSGFRLHYSIGGCNRTFNSTSGTVRSRRANVCHSTFQAPEGSFINLYFKSSYIYTRGENCTTSHSLRVYDGLDTSAPLLLSFCGYRLASPVFSTGNALYLEFARQRGGYFDLTYTTSTQGGGCGGTMHVSSSAQLTSPGYPGPAGPNLECVFTITVQPNQHVILNFQSIDFGSADGCNSTYLEMYDMTLSGQPTLYNTFCGEEGLTAAHLAPSSSMALRYVTGASNITGQGWKAWIHQGQPHESTVLDEEE